MKCDRCKTEESYWTLNRLSAKQTKKEYGYRDLIGGSKLLFCNDCYPVVAKS